MWNINEYDTDTVYRGGILAPQGVEFFPQAKLDVCKLRPLPPPPVNAPADSAVLRYSTEYASFFLPCHSLPEVHK